VLSHHMVIRDGKIANYHPYPPTPWNGSVRDVYGTPGPYEDAVQNTPIFEENSKEPTVPRAKGRAAAWTVFFPQPTLGAKATREGSGSTAPRGERDPKKRRADGRRPRRAEGG